MILMVSLRAIKMRRTLVAMFGLGSCLALPARAEPIVVSTVTTSVLATLCQRSASALDADFCTGYITAAFDQLSGLRLICPGVGVTTEQLIAVGRRFIEAHPETWDRHPSLVLQVAFKTAFACPAR